jgi:hypothetical protein
MVYGAAVNGLLALTWRTTQVTADQGWLAWDGHKWESRFFVLVAEDAGFSDSTVWIRHDRVKEYFESGVQIEVLPGGDVPPPDRVVAVPPGSTSPTPLPSESLRCMDIKQGLMANLLIAAVTPCKPASP